MVLLPMLFSSAFAVQNPRTLAIRDATVVDLSDGSLKENQTILVSDSSIDLVGASVDISIPAGSEVVEAKGKFIIPGLWDMHVHTVDLTYFSQFVANGVTGIRDMGGGARVATDGCESIQSEQLNAWRSRIAANELIGPSIVLSGPAASGTGWPTSLSVRTADEAKAAIGTLQARGVDFVKVYEAIPLVAYEALADAAHEIGLPLAGHVPEETVGLLDAISARQRSIEHVRAALLMCFTDDPAEHARFMVDDHWAGDDVTWGAARHRECQKVIEALQLRRVWLTPTLVVERAKVAVEENEFVTDSRRTSLPSSVQDGFAAFVLDKRSQSPTDRASEHLWWRTQQRLVRRMNQSGVALLAGTDSACEGGLPGYSLHTELALLVDAGLSPLEALRSATLEPARYFESTESMGVIAAGAVADLVLLDSNPLEDIANTRHIHAVVLRGRILTRADLDSLTPRVPKQVSD